MLYYTGWNGAAVGCMWSGAPARRKLHENREHRVLAGIEGSSMCKCKVRHEAPKQVSNTVTR